MEVLVNYANLVFERLAFRSIRATLELHTEEYSDILTQSSTINCWLLDSVIYTKKVSASVITSFWAAQCIIEIDNNIMQLINMNNDRDQYHFFKRILFSDPLNHGHTLVQSYLLPCNNIHFIY